MHYHVNCNFLIVLYFVGVFVEVPMATSETETITLRGPQEMMGKALTLVYGKVQHMCVCSMCTCIAYTMYM